MENLAKISAEQQLVAEILKIFIKAGLIPGQKMEKVVSVSLGIVRLSVGEVYIPRLGNVNIYHASFDPLNKKGILFDEYLENVEIHLIGLNRQTGASVSDYRECKVEAQFLDPTTLIRNTKRYIIKTDKMTGMSKVVVSWLDRNSLLRVSQALDIVRIVQ